MRSGGPLFRGIRALEARPPQMQAQPMVDRQLLKRLAATPTPSSAFPEARPPQTLARRMEDRRLLKRPAAAPISPPQARLPQTRLLLRCWVAPQTRPQQ